MLIKVDFSALNATKWHEYAVRFLFGGLITAMNGIIAQESGPIIGGLFLAFPAIFPAAATLIEKHEKKKKNERGLAGSIRARKATSVDAAGCAMGSIGLFVFALVCWKFMSIHGTAIVLASATLCWLATAVLAWHLRREA
jgi:uncharacterized membrane protein (GlpM family)